MKKSDLFLLIRSFSPIELREVRKFLASPFFNQRNDLVQLFEYLAQNEAPSKVEAWANAVDGQVKYTDQKIRLLMSYLHRLLEQYLTVKQVMANEMDMRMQLALAYQERDMTDAFERSAKRLEATMAKQPRRDAHFHQINERMQWERYQVDMARNPTDPAPLHHLADCIDIAYLSDRLRVMCMEVAQGGIYSSDYQISTEKIIIEMAEVPTWQQLPAISFYLNCYRMLRQPDVDDNFQQFKNLLVGAKGQFTPEEMRELLTHAVNFCIRRINRGERKYAHEALELYKSALKNGYLLEGKVLTRFTYHNIVAAGLQTGELDWVEAFLHEHKNSIPRKYRESSFSFNLARLEYTRHNHDALLELLQKANYRDPLLNLAAKTLLLKTYFDLDEYDLLQSHLDAMRNYIRRKRVIAYHRTNYLNIIRYTEKLLRLNFLDKKEVEKLREAMESEKVLTEREWLVERLTMN